jgi:tetratricopeptide (TPR) repeat protein
MPIIFTAILLFLVTSPSFAASFNWVDREGFHSVDRINDVPLAHRKDLPMAKNLTSLPFSAEENHDGAMFVWYIFDQEGLDYPFTKAADFPQSPFFKEVQERQPADIAWWKGFVAIFRGEKGTLFYARGDLPLKAEEKTRGKARWFRYNGPPTLKPPLAAKKAPQNALKAANDSLLHMNGAAMFPPKVKDDTDRDILRGNLEKENAKLEMLRKKYPDDPQVLRLLGVLFRMEYNLGVQGAWERAEAYLLRTEELMPEAPDAYISLGILYGDTQRDYARQAERQFRLALRHARKEQLQQIWWGLSLALYYQGKEKEAVEIIDRLIALRPGDEKAKKLRETFLTAGEEGKK